VDSSLGGIPLLNRAIGHGDRVAIRDSHGPHSYEELDRSSARWAAALLAGRMDLEEARVAFMVPAGAEYVAVQWGIWRAGGIAVPLCGDHPPLELARALDDAGVGAIVCATDGVSGLRPLAAERGARLWVTGAEELPISDAEPMPDARLPQIDPHRRAMILFTSGTTSRPKGVVSTHAMIEAQVRSLVEAWEWESTDRILHILPLHHTHGIINALACAMWVGATCHMQGDFDARRVWETLAEGEVTLFMAVPTVYVRLIAAWESAESDTRRRWAAGAVGLRLMVSGSAALPASVFARWEEITGHRLLERYGMTEIGMGLSNPRCGDRRPGAVGQPLPGVEIRLVDEAGRPVTEEGHPGEIQVRGPGVFQEYWGQPEATCEAFTGDWFKTGDIAQVEAGYYRILGRSSVDIIKTGGYKVSAIEIEEALRTHPQVLDCAVVGVPDDEWGERVCAAVVLASKLETEALDAWIRERLARYKLPRVWLLVDDLPRNAMGKVQKPAVKAMFAGGA
jgi:malonyl-CoA/methylmalonyl-CoA synthetase